MRSQQEMVVPSPLLRTKLYVPRSRSGLVPRPRLSERLDPGAAASKLVLVSAPAGFVKTNILTYFRWFAWHLDFGNQFVFGVIGSISTTNNSPGRDRVRERRTT